MIAACKARGVEVVEMGPGVGQVSAAIEDVLPAFDVVFATARMALEAAATGCAVVVADGRGAAGMLTSARWPEWRRQNLGAALLVRPVTEQEMAAALDDYDPEDAREVARQVRVSADLTGYVQDMTALYEAAVKEGITASPAELALHNAALLEDWLPTPTERPWRRLATEKRWAPDWNEEISRVGARLEAAGEKQRVRLKRQIEALGVELREQIDALAARGGAQDDR